MARTMILLLFFLAPNVNSFDPGRGVKLFQDFDVTDRHSRSSYYSDDDDDDSDKSSIFVSESSNTLGDGREMITRESVAFVTDPKTGESVKKRILRNFIKYPNGTVLQVDNEGSGKNELNAGSGENIKNVDKVIEVECITEEDCKDDSYCDRVSFSCKECLAVNATCHNHKQCCKGYLCRNRKCEAITGKEDDPCGSDKDCMKNHCCAYVDGKDLCKPYLEEGMQCGEENFFSPKFPSLFSKKFIENSRRSRCPCLEGFMCEKQESYFMMGPKTCKRFAKKVAKTKANKLKRRKSKLHKQEEMEHDDEIREMIQDDNDGIDRDPDDDDENNDDKNDDDDDDDDEEEEHDHEEHNHDRGEKRQSILDSVPLFVRGLFESLFD